MDSNKYEGEVPTTPETTLTEPEVPTPEPAPVPARVDIRTRVKDGLLNANEQVKDAIVSNYVAEEVSKRIKATTNVLSSIESTEREIRKVKPTPAGYDDKGNAIGQPVFSKEQVENLKKLRESLSRLEKAVELALTKNDFSKVFELGQKESSPQEKN